MRRVFYALMSALSALVLVSSYAFSLHQGEAAPPAATPASTPTPPTTPTSQPDSVSQPAPANEGAAVPAPAAGAFRDGSYTGTAVQTRYGPVQVAITVTQGRISDVQVPQYPTGGGREQRINTQAVPQLIDETVQAQSANIDMVSGATYTINGYLESLQSALDQARP